MNILTVPTGIGVDYAGDASPPDFVMNHFVPTTLKKRIIKKRLSLIIMDYYKGLLNAVERSVHLHGLLTTSRRMLDIN